jgi:hypothetical protein
MLDRTEDVLGKDGAKRDTNRNRNRKNIFLPNRIEKYNG